MHFCQSINSQKKKKKKKKFLTTSPSSSLSYYEIVSVKRWSQWRLGQEQVESQPFEVPINWFFGQQFILPDGYKLTHNLDSFFFVVELIF